MKFFGILPLFGLVAPSLGHYVISNFIVNGKESPMGRCMRMPESTDPLKDLYSSNMACNINGDKGVARVCDIKAGDTITLIWRDHPDGYQAGSLPSGSHDGPCAAYLKHFPSNNVANSAASGGGWFKIMEDGYSGGQWCSEKIRNNGGKMTVKIPTDLKAGQYLLRGEHIALHEPVPQFYVGCVQLVISSAGQKTAPSTVSIPGHMTPDQVAYDFWKGDNKRPKSYTIPGNAKLFNPPANNSPIPSPLLKQTGFDNCIETNANWCAKPVPKFTNTDGCWKAANDCWTQSRACFGSAPISGNKGCFAYEENKCKAAQRHCEGCGSSSCKPFTFTI
ncbi:hypothetical protein BJ508DRAFT_364696 [Ascobolus immersus RN42]|uniref:AA9 family lytic polysaccharide monooxygenase n=1 Tax=Ascobolus immersus RN42 TaxID=1160509 RepID=A0A3N4HTU0_ASCIM|nr:hypothetical protein BJ508DRAFT_364696 [Ascobolus immersus RN42]